MANKDDLIKGEALLGIADMDGYMVIEKMLKDIMESAKERLTSRKHCKSYNDVLWYQAKYDNAAKILFTIDRQKQSVLKAREENV